MRSSMKWAVRTVAPSVYWRARNAHSLAQWCLSRMLGSRPADESAYDDGFWAFHDTGDWDRLAALVIDRFAPRTVADIGCGDGKLLAALKRAAPEIRETGYDSSAAALSAARQRGVRAEQFDLAFSGRRASEALAARVRGCDVAISLETAEHLPPWSARPLVHVLTQAPVVVFSAAQPMQGGTLHMNERPQRYWDARFAAAGFAVHPGDAAFRADVSQLDLPWWSARNIRIYSRRRA